MKKSRTTLIGIIALILIIIIAIVIYTTAKTSAQGSVNVHTIHGDTIYVDGIQKATAIGNTTTVSKLSVDKHSVTVSRKGFWPWQKDIQVQSTSTVNIDPYFVPENVQGLIMTSSNQNYKTAVNLLSSVQVPTVDKKRISKDGNVAAWDEDESVVVQWVGPQANEPAYFCQDEECNNETFVIHSKSPITNIDFFGERNDAIIYSNADGIHVISVDHAGIQNYAPLLIGSNSLFAISPDDAHTVYIQSLKTITAIQI